MSSPEVAQMLFTSLAESVQKKKISPQARLEFLDSKLMSDELTDEERQDIIEERHQLRREMERRHLRMRLLELEEEAGEEGEEGMDYREEGLSKGIHALVL